jgi:hypothetical protein
MKRILLSIIIITALAGYVGASTYASYTKGHSDRDDKHDDRHDDRRDDNHGRDDDRHDDHDNGCGSKCSAQLLVGNKAYYNGASVPAISWAPTTSLTGKTFFAFNDVKPDDLGGNGITVRSDKKDVWACMDLTLTANDDHGSTEPELTVDTPDNVTNRWDGEIAQALSVLWWADDGDQVFEQGEAVLGGGVRSLFALASSSGRFVLPLADRTTHAWGKPVGTPLRAGTTYTLGTAWCMGTLTLDPQNAGSAGPYTGSTPRGLGVQCDGALLGNITQTDTLGLSLTMRIEEAQNNTSFSCKPATAGGGGGPVFTHGSCRHPSRTGVHYDSFEHRKGNDAREVHLGADVDTKSRRAEQGHAWVYGGAPNAFTFTYDKARNSFTSTVGTGATVTYKNGSTGASCPAAKWNVLEIRQNGERVGGVSVHNVRVNGKQYGTLASSRAQDSWTLSGLNLSQGFTVTGDIRLAGRPAKNGTGDHVSIVVGCDTL